MIPKTCISIETEKFPVLEGEEDELINEGMYGKALCEYLEKQLPLAGVEVPFFVCEDWGWWVEVKDKDFTMGLCIYSDPDVVPTPKQYAVISSITNEKKFVWKKFKKINVSTNVLKILDIVEKTFKNDPAIRNVARHNEYPW